ncbi:MAG: hypothetical protein JWP37_473, partial [Mucilaginibacter sp.]|nr:hypothetical protein [Mucilaginibacter sp.]
MKSLRNMLILFLIIVAGSGNANAQS